MFHLSLPKTKVLLFTILIIAGFLVRLYRFDNPIADWHSWRQADTSAVSRNFVLNGFDLLHPKFDDLSNVPSGLDNPMGYRFVEFPIYNLFQAAGFKFIGILTLEEWGRLVTILASLLSSVFLYKIISQRLGEKAGFWVMFFFLFLPFNIYYSRTILPDPSMVMASLGGIYFFQVWLNKDKKLTLNFQFLLAVVFTAVACLLKPYALFFTLTMVYLAIEKFGYSLVKKWQLYVFLIISIIPLFLWRQWITNFPQGIPASLWLFNSNHIRFRPSFFYWIIYVRILKLILGFFGSVFVGFAFLNKLKSKDYIFILSFLVSSIIYVCTLATGNVQHDYYQILIVPSIAILMGIGANRFLQLFGKKQIIGILTVLIISFAGFYISWGQVKDYFNINNRSIIEAGIAVDKLTPQNAKVIANYNGDTSFLYQTKRKGWASFEKPIPQMITQLGADFLVLANPTNVDLNLGKTYKIVVQNKEFVLFDLKQRP